MSTLGHFFKSTSDAGSSSSAAVPAFAFLAAQRKTEKVASTGKKRGSYATTSEELKAKVTKYAAENGASAPLRHFKQELDLKESTVCGWVTTYQKRCFFLFWFFLSKNKTTLWIHLHGSKIMI